MKNSLILVSILATSALLFFYNYTGRKQTDPKVKGQLTGNQLYTKYCSTCHQADGKGVRGMFPPLSGNEKVTGPSSEIIRIVLFGLQGPITVNEREYNQPMPPQNYLTDKQISDILTYVRSSWENKASSVTPDEVLKARKLGKVKPS
jgi:mono/diheme cytochrome c family protein